MRLGLKKLKPPRLVNNHSIVVDWQKIIIFKDVGKK